MDQSINDNSPTLNVINNHESRLGIAWRIGLVFIAVTGIWLLMHELTKAVFGIGYSREAHIFRAIVISSLVIPFIFIARRYLDRRPWAGLALGTLREAWRPLFIGIVCWLIPAMVGLVICVGFGWTEITLNEPFGETVRLFLGLMVLVFIYEALPEELIFRGYFYRNLANVMPGRLAVLAQAILFVVWGLVNGGENSVDRSVLFFVAAIVLGIFRVVTGSVWASIGFHLAFQTVTQLFGSVGNHFTVTEPQTLTVFAFGILPFAIAITLLNKIATHQPNWLEREPQSGAL